MTAAKPPARQRAVGALASGFATTELHHQAGHDPEWIWRTGSLIGKSRDELAARCLGEPQTSHILWIDADIAWSPNDVVRLLSHDVDVAAGLYSYRTFVDGPAQAGPPGRQLAWCALETNDHRPPIDRARGLLEIAGAGLGFMLTKRMVYERMIEAYPKSRIFNARAFESEHAEAMPFLCNFFPLLLEDGTLMGEDIAFCKRWREIGGTVWADPTIQLGHHGEHIYTCNPMGLFRLSAGQAA